MKKGLILSGIAATAILFISGCGGGGGGANSETITTNTATTYTGIFIDSRVEGLEYKGNLGSSGTTDEFGHFKFKDGETITFKIGNVILGDITPSPQDPIITPVKLADATDANDTKVLRIVQFLLTVDEDKDPTNNITIPDSIKQKLKNKPPIKLDENILEETVIKNYLEVTNIKTENEALSHMKQSLTEINEQKIELENEIKKSENKNDENSNTSNNTESNYENGYENDNTQNSTKNEENENSDNNENFSSSINATPQNTSDYQLLAWNDLGMHCMDGNDYSIFSILPPYNNLVAQLVKKENSSAHLVTTGVTITYEAEKSLDGKLNTTSSNKTNFWNYVLDLFGVSLQPDVGLKGKPVQSKTPTPMTYDDTHNWWIAEGIPTSPKNDDNTSNHYPLVKVVAKDSNGNILATTTTVLPVSDEMDCKKCHSSTSGNQDAMPEIGWVNNSDQEKDYKLNILRLHDEKHPTAVSDYINELKNKGYDYKTTGLEATALGGKPILCASCHKSNALPGTGIDSIKPLTAAIHSKHANVNDPSGNGLTLNEATNRNACYACHPGAITQCLRGAMGKAKDNNGNNIMQCQSCHGTMNAVGSLSREGWFDEPSCQNCHQDGQRYTEAVTDMSTGTLRTAIDTRFATNPNTPIPGKNLYRFSTGHGKLKCSACHGSPHAIYPSIRAEDNIQSLSAQGHIGTISECTTCHKTVPNTISGGPHGMHTVGQNWIELHEDAAKNNLNSCAVCHGNDYRGSNLSKTFSARSFSVEHGTKSFPAGHKVSCYDCHNGPNGED